MALPAAFDPNKPLTDKTGKEIEHMLTLLVEELARINSGLGAIRDAIEKSR